MVRLLPDSLIDQIAAGEVVERPASVVKELVENSLDAGATRIEVEVRDGGTGLIAVTDDGTGMPRGDALLALERHATSKLRVPGDLLGIRSFGFRGEALPAIASVSRLRLRTRQRGAREGWEIRVDAGNLIEERAAGGPEGTRVEVADLFATVPARRKFLKRPTTEWGHISDWLGRLALSLPGVHFEVRRDDRPALVWPASEDPLDRIAAVLSESVAGTLVPARWEGPEGHIEAYVSGPEHSRPNAAGLYLFVNGRPVRDPVLRHAVIDAYRDLLARGRFPIVVLFVTVAHESVDVNVHPAKWEVRFANPSAIHGLVRHCIRAAMAERRWLGTAAGTSPTAGAIPEPRSAYAGGPAEPIAAVGERPASDWVFAQQPELRGDAGEGSLGRTASSPVAEEPERLQFQSLRILGQLLASYLLLEGKQGLILVDQHAAHERVLYERLRAQWLDRGVEQQPLLIPETIEIEALAAAAVVESADRIRHLGFDVEPFGDQAVMVRGIPALLAGHDPARLVRDLARELQDPGAAGEGTVSDTRLLQAADRVFATLACHSARRFGDHLEPEEQRAILHGLDQIPWAPTCPHGRPVAAAIDLAEIERRFGRR